MNSSNSQLGAVNWPTLLPLHCTATTTLVKAEIQFDSKMSLPAQKSGQKQAQIVQGMPRVTVY